MYRQKSQSNSTTPCSILSRYNQLRLKPSAFASNFLIALISCRAAVLYKILSIVNYWLDHISIMHVHFIFCINFSFSAFNLHIYSFCLCACSDLIIISVTSTVFLLDFFIFYSPLLVCVFVFLCILMVFRPQHMFYISCIVLDLDSYHDSQLNCPFYL